MVGMGQEFEKRKCNTGQAPDMEQTLEICTEYRTRTENGTEIKRKGLNIEQALWDKAPVSKIVLKHPTAVMTNFNLLGA